jgi:hypothetical protein
MIEAKQLYGTTLTALDGDTGSVHDLYFGDPELEHGAPGPSNSMLHTLSETLKVVIRAIRFYVRAVICAGVKVAKCQSWRLAA